MSDYTEAEKQVIRDNPTMAPRDLVGLLPGRSLMSVSRVRWGIVTNGTKHNWSEEEIQTLRDYRHLNASVVAEMLGRSEGAVYNKRKKLGLLKLHHCRVCGEPCGIRGWTCRSHRKFFDSFKYCKEGAEKRGHSFELSHKDFLEVAWDKSCIYCGANNSNYGIDRVDNSKGYIRDNVVPCCIDCNRMKRKMSVVEWFAHMRKILNRADLARAAVRLNVA